MFNKLKSALLNNIKKETANSNIRSLTLKLSGMHCSSCAVNIDLALEEISGIESVKTHFPSSTSVIKYDPSQATVTAITDAIKKLGYETKTIE